MFSNRAECFRLENPSGCGWVAITGLLTFLSLPVAELHAQARAADGRRIPNFSRQPYGQPQAQPPVNVTPPVGSNQGFRPGNGLGPEYGYPYRPYRRGGVNIFPSYQTNIIAPPGYFYDPIDGFVPYALRVPGYGFGYGYGYRYSGFSGVFGSGGFVGTPFGTGFAGVGPGVAVAGGGVVPVPAPVAPRRPVVAARQSVLVDTHVRTNPALPQVEVEFTNKSKRDLEVTLVHLLDPDANQRFRIPAGDSVTTLIERDAGSEKVSVYETYDALGNPVTREVARDIRPEVLYEVVVHEWAMQSVAIDRTGKSPQVIEDINMQGRGVGRFRLPAGKRFRGGRVDVYGAAKAANNAGSVGPITAAADELETDNASKLERAVFEAQRAAMNRAK